MDYLNQINALNSHYSIKKQSLISPSSISKGKLVRKPLCVLTINQNKLNIKKISP